MLDGRHMIEGQRLLQVLLTGCQVFRDGRNDDIGSDSAVLRAVAVDPVELLNRQLERAELGGRACLKLVAEVDDRLHRPLAVGARVADDQRPAVILQGSREDLRSAGTEPADEDQQRTGVDRPLLRIIANLHLALEALYLNDRSLVNEETRQG